MNGESLQFQLSKYLGPSNPLVIYYDFLHSSVFSVQSGGSYQAYLRNASPSSQTGFYDGKIIGATGDSSSGAMSLATGIGGFMTNGAGDFTKNNIQISGSSSIDLKNCSYLILTESDLSDDGVIFGSFEKTIENIDGFDVVSSKGFNFGVTDRGHNFFQSLGKDGEFCFIKNKDELTKRNLVGLTFNNSEVFVHRFDYLNNKVHSESFVFQTSNIKNSENVYLGSTPSYWRGENYSNLFSGKIEKFVVISGRLPKNVLYEIGKGFFSEYSFSSGGVTSGEVLSGFTTLFSYKTGITGSYAEITGYTSVRSGVDEYSQSVLSTGSIQIKDGETYYENYSNYIEKKGLLNSGYENTYYPTGESAHATLGLQTGLTTVSGYEISEATPQTSVLVPLYKITNLYGTTNEISGIVNTPVYNTVYFTGADSSGIAFSDQFSGFTKNQIYYLGWR